MKKVASGSGAQCSKAKSNLICEMIELDATIDELQSIEEGCQGAEVARMIDKIHRERRELERAVR